MLIDLNNIEELIFYNQEIQVSLPEFKPYFDSWRLSVQAPYLRNLGKRAMIDFMQEIQPIHISIIESILKIKISFDKLDYHSVKNIQFNIEDDYVNELNNLNWVGDICIHRTSNQIYISYWR